MRAYELKYRGEDLEPGEEVVVVGTGLKQSGMHGILQSYDESHNLIVKFKNGTTEKFRSNQVFAPEEIYGDGDDDEEINEVNPALGNLLTAATKGLGVGAKSTLNIGGKLANNLGKGVGKASSGMAMAMKKKVGNTVPTGQLSQPPQNVNNPNQSQVQPQLAKTGDDVEIPGVGPSKILKTDGMNITLQLDPKDPTTTITMPKKKLGLK